MSGDTRLDAINRRLAEIAALLSDSAHEPSPTHLALLTERDYLHAEASRYHSRKDEARTTSDLHAELAELQRRLKALVSSHTGYVTGKGGNSSGPVGGAWVKLAQQSRQGGEIDRLNSRIAEIEDELSNRNSAG